MRFFILEPPIKYDKFSYYSTFVNELIKNEEDSSLLDPQALNSLPTSINKLDCIFLGLGFFDFPTFNHFFPSLAESKSLKVAYLHKVKSSYEEKINFCKAHEIDFILTTTPLEQEIATDSGIPTYTLPYGADPESFYPIPNVEKIYDISFSGAMHENKQGVPEELKNIRFKARDILQKRDDLKIFWNGSDDPSQSYRINQEEYTKKINQSKIWYAATGPAWDMNPRHSEILFCKTVLLTNTTPKGFYDLWEDGFICSRYKPDLSDFNKKIDEALEKQDFIVENAYNFAVDNLTPGKIYEKFKWIINQDLKKY